MTKSFKAATAALMALCLLATAACSTDDDIAVDISQYNDCIISKMTMGTLFRNVTNTDTTYRVGVTGSLYPLSIDHRQGLICNTDSLPVGTDVAKVAFADLTSSGYLAIRSLSTGKDTAFVATDSTDCSTERLITVTAYDEVSKRTYRLHINVHQEEGDSMTWQTRADGNTDIATFEGRVKAVGTQWGVALYGHKNGTAKVLVTTDGGKVWNETALPEGFDTQGVCRQKGTGTWWAIATDGLMASANGEDWTRTGGAEAPQKLLCADRHGLTAIKDGAIVTTTDGGMTWTSDPIADNTPLPTDELQAVALSHPTDSKLVELMLTGRDADGQMAVWRRTVDLTGVNVMGWYKLPMDASFALPALSQMALDTYDGHVVTTGQTADGAPAPIYMSQDQGRTWKLQGLKQPGSDHASGGLQTLAVDDGQHIWLIDLMAGTALSARHNRLGWAGNREIRQRD